MKANRSLLTINKFRREKLPSPSSYFKTQGILLSGRAEWKDAQCPFHNDTRPSLRVRLDTGAFRCMVCGAHGGDVLAFHRKLKRLGFADAAKELGAWEH